MAEVAKNSQPDLSSPVPEPLHRDSMYLAAETLAAGDVVCVRPGDTKVWRATGVASGANAKAWGIIKEDYYLNQPVTFVEARFHYGDALVPGTKLFVSGTVPGGLADAASTGGTVACAVVLDDQRIHFKANYFTQ